MEEEKERVKAKRAPKSVRKSPVKRVKVKKKDSSKPKSCKGPGATSQKQAEGRELTREERVTKLEKQKVLNERVFDPKILTDYGMSTLFDSVSLESWEHMFEAPAPYLHGPEVREFYCKWSSSTVEASGQQFESEFTQRDTKRGDIKCAGLLKKFLMGEYQLMFEFINKILVPRSEKRQ
ncbi:hypothetical protein KY284_024116 [Solanum tuberosum]|nr:hypothetical protein KY284_024116 [Solanum tuberosum]